MGDDGNHNHNYLRAKIQIGNVKGPVSYSLGQTVFHHDDIPEAKRLRRNEVKAWVKSKVLSAERPSWSKSTDPNVPVVIRRQAENFAHDRGKAYQYNYRAETLDSLRMVEPIDKPTKFHISGQLESTALRLKEIRANNRIQRGQFTRTGEMPVHPDLEDLPSWNNSTEINLREKDIKLDTITRKALDSTTKVNINPNTFSAKSYKGPLKSAIELQNIIRQQKAEGTFSLKKQVNRPGSAPVDRTLLVNRFAVEHRTDFHTDSHSGIYEVNRVDGRAMWSDTGNEMYISQGDTRRRKNLDSLNVLGPNMSQNRYVHGKSVPQVSVLPQSSLYELPSIESSIV